MKTLHVRMKEMGLGNFILTEPSGWGYVFCL